MLIRVQAISGDDVSFLHGFCGLTSKAVQQGKPHEVYVIRIDNWFDVKWLGFSGKAKVVIDTGVPSVDSEVRPIWDMQTQVTFPPFVPNRVLAQEHYRYDNGSLVQSSDDVRYVYSGNKQRSGKNLQNRVLDFSPSAMYFWFSSKSAANGRASMMYYHAKKGRLSAWYVSFVRDKAWRVNNSRNMDKDAIEQYFQAGVAEGAT